MVTGMGEERMWSGCTQGTGLGTLRLLNKYLLTKLIVIILVMVGGHKCGGWKWGVGGVVTVWVEVETAVRSWR